MSIRHGTRPSKIDHRDYDFLKSHKLGGIDFSQGDFKDEYFADAGLTMPNQGAIDTEFSPPTPIEDYGCTNFAQADLATDLTKTIHNPNDIEAITHANAKGGLDIRESLDAARELGWFKQYFNIKTNGRVDPFDAFRVSQMMGIDAGESRSITWGTPWFPSWEKAAQAGQSIMPMPTEMEIYTANALPWHDSKLDGWTNINGRLVYRNKSWQGNMIGDRGFLYFPREVINMVMTIRGTVGYMGTLQYVEPERIDTTTIEWLISAIRNLLVSYV